MMKRPDPSEYQPHYARYIDLVPETDLPEAMLEQIEETSAMAAEIPESLHDHRYAEGKWTIREVFGHISDTERILGFRLLSFARGETADFTRADEDLYVQNAGFSECELEALLEEFELVRRSNVMLLRQLPPEALDRIGSISGSQISVRAIGYLMLGHERHHLNIIKDKYLA